MDGEARSEVSAEDILAAIDQLKRAPSPRGTVAALVAEIASLNKRDVPRVAKALYELKEHFMLEDDTYWRELVTQLLNKPRI